MSVVVALIDHGSVYLASDSLITRGHSCCNLKQPKWYKLNDGTWFCWAGNAKFGQTAKSTPFPKHIPDIDSVIEWVSTFKPNDHNMLKDVEYECMIVGDGKIFSFYEDRFVVEVEEKFQAIGSGADIALGVLDAFDAFLTKIEPFQKVMNAVESAIKFNTYCGGTVHTQIV